jgi:hypothetical protein
MEILNELLNKQLEFQKSLELINKKFDDQVQKKPVVHLDHQAIANQIKAGLPSADQFEKANEQMRRTISNIPDRIPVQTSGQILGFTNLKALLVHYGIFFSLLVLVGLGVTYSKNQEIESMKEYRRRAENFIGWIQEKYPKVWEKWKEN